MYSSRSSGLISLDFLFAGEAVGVVVDFADAVGVSCGCLVSGGVAVAGAVVGVSLFLPFVFSLKCLVPARMRMSKERLYPSWGVLMSEKIRFVSLRPIDPRKYLSVPTSSFFVMTTPFSNIFASADFTWLLLGLYPRSVSRFWRSSQIGRS